MQLIQAIKILSVHFLQNPKINGFFDSSTKQGLHYWKIQYDFSLLVYACL